MWIVNVDLEKLNNKNKSEFEFVSERSEIF